MLVNITDSEIVPYDINNLATKIQIEIDKLSSILRKNGIKYNYLIKSIKKFQIKAESLDKKIRVCNGFMSYRSLNYFFTLPEECNKKSIKRINNILTGVEKQLLAPHGK